MKAKSEDPALKERDMHHVLPVDGAMREREPEA
jgi:hypothetical protein